MIQWERGDGLFWESGEPILWTGQAAPTGHRVVVRIDGKLHAGTYREIADLVGSLARNEAGDARAPSARKARAAARRQTAGITRRLQIETPLQFDAPPAIIEDRMLRDLRDVYSRSLVAAMTEPNKQLIEAENMKAIEAALEMLL